MPSSARGPASSLPEYVIEGLVQFNNLPTQIASNTCVQHLDVVVRLAGFTSFCIWEVARYSGRYHLKFEDCSRVAALVEHWRTNEQTYEGSKIYAARAVTKERSHDECVFCKLSKWLGRKGVQIDRQRSTLSYFAQRQTLCRVDRGHLVRGPAWNDAELKAEEFAEFLAQLDQAREARRYRL